MTHGKSQIFVLILLLFLVAACRPKGILSSRQMREVMIDLHKTDALLQINGLQHGHDEEKNIYYVMVLEQHGITQAQFDSSLVWYTAHPQLFDKIYPKVIAQLTAEQEAYAATHADELNLMPLNTTMQPDSPALSRDGLDSILWVMQHGYPAYGWLERQLPAPEVPFAPTP